MLILAHRFPSIGVVSPSHFFHIFGLFGVSIIWIPGCAVDIVVRASVDGSADAVEGCDDNDQEDSAGYTDENYEGRSDCAAPLIIFICHGGATGRINSGQRGR